MQGISAEYVRYFNRAKIEYCPTLGKLCFLTVRALLESFGLF